MHIFFLMAREPFLPGFNFENKQGKDYHLRQQFSIKNGYGIPKLDLESITLNEPVPFETTYDFIKFDPLERFTKITKSKPLPYKPHYVINDGRCLSFQGYFRTDIPEFSPEKQFYRKINIVYYLEDDTITIIEPPVANAGYLQGRIVRRGRIPKPRSNETWHWKHLNIGIDIEIYGILYHISSCDQFTREYLLSRGIEVNENEEIPRNVEINHSMRKFSCYHSTQDTSSQDKLYRFLQYDRKVLRFYALWDDRGNEFGDISHYKVHYYLIDDTVEIKQVKDKFKQNEPFHRLLSRTKLPKNYSPGTALQVSASVACNNVSNQEYYEPKDFLVGGTISVLGREFFLYDCDQFTRRYYRDCLKIEQPASISIRETCPEPVKKEIPPHTGIGQPEDTLQSCLSIVPKPPKKDIIHYIENTNKVLRYSAKMDSTSDTDKDRKFIIQYSLADGKISIYEIKTLNSGFPSGYFLKSALVPKPLSLDDNVEYYSPADFAIDSKIEIFGRKFLITGADLAVYRYMEKRPEKFRPEIMKGVKEYLQREGIIDEEAKEVEHVDVNDE